ncbi:F0F1 ATP synthase subunit delta [Brevibacterium litoralis]|uniref:F0F1 ATP synthase subunit delta n=1 Tax=Brevibacterium litoralis TaxID=3138935 RepID=UPI0032EB92D0
MLQSSRNSLSRTLQQVNSAIDAGQAAPVARGLLDVVSVLAENAQLRKVLADASIEASRKDGLLASLFSGQVDGTALEIATAAAGQRWARTQDYVTALEVAGVTAVAAEAQAAGQLGRVEEEVFRFSRLTESDHQLGWALGSPAPAGAKRTLVADLLGGRASDFTLTLVSQAVSHPRGKRVSEALDEYSSTLAARQRRSVAEVTVAKPLDEAQQERLRAALSASYGRELVLNVTVDPTVVGGVRVRVGDEVMNGSISDRLSDVRRRLTS